MDYEVEIEKITKENYKYLNEFKKWLIDKKISSKTINLHVENASLYINDYLNYYEINEMPSGCFKIDGFLGNWFIRKCLWSTALSIRSTAASIKKFIYA